jgi:hypothetical protein
VYESLGLPGLSFAKPDRAVWGKATLAFDSKKQLFVSSLSLHLADPEAQRTETAQQEKYEQDYPEATKRAQALLFSFLTDDQEQVFRRVGNVCLKKNDKRYVIKRQRVGNVFVDYIWPPENERANSRDTSGFWETIGFCFIPHEPYPLEDQILAHKLMIEADEANFLDQAKPYARYIYFGPPNGEGI